VIEGLSHRRLMSDTILRSRGAKGLIAYVTFFLCAERAVLNTQPTLYKYIAPLE